MMRLFILVTLWVGSEETRERRSPKSQIEKGGSITLMNKCYLDGMVVWDYYKDKNLYESGKCICYAHSNNNHIVDMTNRCIEQSQFYYQGVDELTKLQFGLRIKNKPYMDDHYFMVQIDFLRTEIYYQSGKVRTCELECKQFVNQGVKEWNSKIIKVKAQKPLVVYQNFN